MRFHRGRGVARKAKAGKGDTLSDIPPQVAHNIEEVVRLEGKDRMRMGASDHFADRVTHFSGSMLFVWLHVAWFTTWILLNVAGIVTFDQFPFGFLTMTVSLEAIFLSTFVLISQNRLGLQADRRAKLDLQVNLLAEQEITKLMSLVAEVHAHLGLGGKHDAELEHMQQETQAENLAEAVDEAEAGIGLGNGPGRADETKHEKAD